MKVSAIVVSGCTCDSYVKNFTIFIGVVLPVELMKIFIIIFITNTLLLLSLAFSIMTV